MYLIELLEQKVDHEFSHIRFESSLSLLLISEHVIVIYQNALLAILSTSSLHITRVYVVSTHFMNFWINSYLQFEHPIDSILPGLTNTRNQLNETVVLLIPNSQWVLTDLLHFYYTIVPLLLHVL